MTKQLAEAGKGQSRALIGRWDRNQIRRVARPMAVVGAVLLFAMWGLWLRLDHPPASRRPSRRPSRIRPPVQAPAPRSPSDVALREACQDLTRAVQRAREELDQFEAADPQPETPHERADRQQRWLTLDEGGWLARARVSAARAAALARTPAELYQATQLLAGIEHDLGNHPAELKHARLLVRLAPRKPEAQMLLLRAARCNGLDGLARQAEAARERLAPSPPLSSQFFHPFGDSARPQESGPGEKTP